MPGWVLERGHGRFQRGCWLCSGVQQVSPSGGGRALLMPV